MPKRLLDIVVTHYKEPWQIVRPFFDALNAQRGIDFSLFKVWFVQDGPCEDIFPKGYLKDSPLEIEKIAIPHKGVSAARNAGLDAADSEWICFCDCDDSFASIYSLKMIFYVLKDDQSYDLMWNPFYMNYLDDKGSLVKNDTYNHVWIHNKYYRLSFLKDKNIRFPEGIFMSEDSAFNNIVEIEAANGRIGQINTPEPLYAWVRRPGSITTDPDRYYKNSEGHFERNVWVLNEYRKRKHPRAKFVCARTITDAYSMLTKYPENEESVRISKKVAAFYKENQYIWRSVSKEAKKLSLEASERETGTLGTDIPGKPKLENWLKWLRTL